MPIIKNFNIKLEMLKCIIYKILKSGIKIKKNKIYFMYNFFFQQKDDNNKLYITPYIFLKEYFEIDVI